MGRDAAIDFDHCGRFRFVDHGTQFPDLLQRIGHERLSAESRLDAHDEHQVDQGYDVAQHLDVAGLIEMPALAPARWIRSMHPLGSSVAS